jgi:zinc protease
VLTGAKGVNLWTSFRVPPPQRKSRIYRALVETGLASSILGQMIPTAQPFLYTISATATEGMSLSTVEAAALEALSRVQQSGVTPNEVERARAQLQARLVFDNDSVTNIGHQLGYFETIASVDIFNGLDKGIEAVTLDQVNEAARTLLVESNRTIGWFDPLPVARS